MKCEYWKYCFNWLKPSTKSEGGLKPISLLLCILLFSHPHCHVFRRSKRFFPAYIKLTKHFLFPANKHIHDHESHISEIFMKLNRNTLNSITQNIIPRWLIFSRENYIHTDTTSLTFEMSFIDSSHLRSLAKSTT